VQDYHLMLVGSYMGLLRPDVKTVHFTHTPFCSPDELDALPETVARELLMSMKSYGACGFHSSAWQANFDSCCREMLGGRPTTFVAPLGVDHTDIRRMAASPRCDRATAALQRVIGDRALLVRVDRLDPAKNVIAGFEAFDKFLGREPKWRERVVFLAHSVPSREGLAEMIAYRDEAQQAVDRINRRWGSSTWQPIVYEVSSDRARSFAALRDFDVLMVNSVRDGLNLVAIEGAMANRRDGVIVLSQEAGVAEHLSGGFLSVDPNDVEATAAALGNALSLGGSMRREMADRARRSASELRTDRWLDRLLEVGTGVGAHGVL
jgi:trehalose 6-phosphate synthase